MIILYDIRVCKLMLKVQLKLQLSWSWIGWNDKRMNWNEFSCVKAVYACKKQKYVLK